MEFSRFSRSSLSVIAGCERGMNLSLFGLRFFLFVVVSKAMFCKCQACDDDFRNKCKVNTRIVLNCGMGNVNKSHRLITMVGLRLSAQHEHNVGPLSFV